MKFHILTLAIVYAVLFTANVSRACSCAEPAPPKAELAKKNAVFTGKVTKIDKREGSTLRVTLEVASAWKGVSTKQVVVETDEFGDSCGFHFEVGSSYLVYAYLGGEEGAKDRQLATNLCTRTRLLDDRAKPEVAELGPPDKLLLE